MPGERARIVISKTPDSRPDWGRPPKYIYHIHYLDKDLVIRCPYRAWNSVEECRLAAECEARMLGVDLGYGNREWDDRCCIFHRRS